MDLLARITRILIVLLVTPANSVRVRTRSLFLLGKNHRTTSHATRTNAGCGGMSLRDDGYPDSNGTPESWCPLCRECCDCNANDPMSCESSTVSGEGGAVVFCSTCE